MKIVQINAVYEYSSTGRNVKELHEYFQKNNIESYVFVSKYRSKKENIYNIGNNFDHKIHALLSRIIGKQGYFSYFATKKLLNQLDIIKPDVVNLHNLHSNFINLNMLLKYLGDNNIATVVSTLDCFLFTGKCCHYFEDNCNKFQTECGKCPALHRYNNSYFFDFTKQMQRDRKYYFDRIKKLGINAPSNWICNEAKKSNVFKNCKNFITINYWIDNDVFYPKEQQKLKEKYNISNKFIILGISQMWDDKKGIDIFIELSKLISKDSIILLIGGCNDNIENEKLKLAGTVNDINILADYYSMADVFINPSIQETFGKTTAEAMACGTPVVGYNSTATPELIGNDEKCGYIVENRKAEEFYEKIKLIKEKGKKHFSENCRKKAINNFDKNKNIEEYIKFYKVLLKN